MLKHKPKEITVCNLEVIVMPNGEVICLGKSLGFIKEFGNFLTPKITLEKATEELESIKKDFDDLKPFRHGEEGTHIVCKSRLKKEGSKASCCICKSHKRCNL